MYKQVASGTASEIAQLGDYQSEFPEGSRGYLELELRSDLAASIVAWLDDRLQSVGVPEERVAIEGKTAKIFFKTAIPPLVLIAGAIAASIVIVALVVAWKLFRLEPGAVIGLTTGVLIVITGAVLIVIYLIATRGRLVAGKVAIGGK